jgi:hypothetical protein
MNVSTLSANDRLAAIAAAVVIITGLISIAQDWGALVFLSLAAGVVALFVVLQPQIAPAVKLPMTKGVLLLAMGAISTVVLLVVALQWMDYILTPPIFVFDTIQYFIGVIAAIVLLFAGWRAYQAEKGATPLAGPPAGPAA